MSDKLLKAQDVARMLGVSKNTIYNLCSQGKLPHYRVASQGRGVLRFTEAHVSDYLASTLSTHSHDDQAQDGDNRNGHDEHKCKAGQPYECLNEDRLRQAWVKHEE